MKTKIDIIPAIQCELSPEQIRILIRDGWPAQVPWIICVEDWLEEVETLSPVARGHLKGVIMDIGEMIATYPRIDTIILC